MKAGAIVHQDSPEICASSTRALCCNARMGASAWAASVSVSTGSPAPYARPLQTLALESHARMEALARKANASARKASTGNFARTRSARACPA